MCRVIKKTEKANDLEVEQKGKTAASSSTNGNDTSMRSYNELFSFSGDVSSQASHLQNQSRYSSPITSPHNVAQMAEFEQPSTE